MNKGIIREKYMGLELTNQEKLRLFNQYKSAWHLYSANKTTENLEILESFGKVIADNGLDIEYLKWERGT